MNIVLVILAFLISYLIGSINFAILISKHYINDDIRNYGSKNAGMTNVLRTVGKKAAAYTVVGDTLKGFIPVFIFKMLFLNYTELDPLIGAYIAGYGAFLGHLFPIYYGFKGGKGILTGSGVMIAISPLVFVVLFIIFLIMTFITKIVSVGSICVALFLPLVFYLVQNYYGDFKVEYFICTTIFALMLLFMHRGNIKRLLNGTENKFKKK